jgi:hypothetical protein
MRSAFRYMSIRPGNWNVIQKLKDVRAILGPSIEGSRKYIVCAYTAAIHVSEKWFHTHTRLRSCEGEWFLFLADA